MMMCQNTYYREVNIFEEKWSVIKMLTGLLATARLYQVVIVVLAL